MTKSNPEGCLLNDKESYLKCLNVFNVCFFKHMTDIMRYKKNFQSVLSRLSLFYMLFTYCACNMCVLFVTPSPLSICHYIHLTPFLFATFRTFFFSWLKIWMWLILTPHIVVLKILSVPRAVGNSKTSKLPIISWK